MRLLLLGSNFGNSRKKRQPWDDQICRAADIHMACEAMDLRAMQGVKPPYVALTAQSGAPAIVFNSDILTRQTAGRQQWQGHSGYGIAMRWAPLSQWPVAPLGLEAWAWHAYTCTTKVQRNATWQLGCYVSSAQNCSCARLTSSMVTSIRVSSREDTLKAVWEALCLKNLGEMRILVHFKNWSSEMPRKLRKMRFLVFCIKSVL